MKHPVGQIRKRMVESCKRDAVTRLRRDFDRRVAVNLKELGYGG